MSKTQSRNRTLQLAAILTIAVLAFGTIQFAAAKDDSRIKLKGNFVGIDDGNAKFESRDGGDRKTFSVEINNVSSNTAFVIDIDGKATFNTASNAFGTLDFNLDTQCEDDGSDCSPIPDLVSGAVVTVTGDGFSTTATLRTK